MNEGMGRVEFTISDLEERTGLNRRTIHFYVKEGIIKPPSGVGGAARYGEEHLLRLLLIRELQKSHLKLSGVREALDRMTVEEMRNLAHKAGPPSHVWDKEALDSWLEGKLPLDMSIADERMDTSSPQGRPWNHSLLDIARGKAQKPAKEKEVDRESRSFLRKSIPSKSDTWARIEITDGVEVHLRSDLASTYRHLIIELAQRIRKKS